jgi:dethiobiotin synthetase
MEKTKSFLRRGIFVTGTDTHVGKTYVTCALLRAAQSKKARALAMKPVASGCIVTEQGLRNHDALQLIESMGEDAPSYDLVNPYALREPIAPHIAAKNMNVQIDIEVIRSAYEKLSVHADYRFVEGAGGWSVPLNEHMLFSSIPIELDLSVLLVVGIRLGCINHAILSARSIQHEGLDRVGWIANQIDPALPHTEGVIDAVSQWLGEAPMAVLPYAEQGPSTRVLGDLAQAIDKSRFF